MKKINSIYFVAYLLITTLILTLLFIDMILIEFSPIKKIIKRNLNETDQNDTSNNNTNYGSDTVKSPFFYLTGYYLIFFLMGLYIICLMKRSSHEEIRENTSEVWKFLYMANNGALLVSLICFSTVYELMGFAPITLGLIIFIIGSSCYLCKLIGNSNYIEEFFNKETLHSLFVLPSYILKLVRYILLLLL